MSNMREVTLTDFAESFGTQVTDLPAKCVDYAMRKDFTYRLPTSEERDNIVLEVLRKIESDTQRIGAPERTDVWYNGWGENLRLFEESGHELDSLHPKFIRPDQPIRFRGDYIYPSNPEFEYDYMTVFRLWLFEEFFGDCERIHEFGCGSGLNLALLREVFPEKELHGLDFVQSSVTLINSIGSAKRWDLTGHLFDMTKPDSAYVVSSGSGILTFGAIEQLASNIAPILDYFLSQKAKRIVHVEPTVELYDDDKLVDYLASRFHRKRGYTEGLLPSIQKLDAEGQARLVSVRRLGFGSLFMEGYMYYVWEPVAGG